MFYGSKRVEENFVGESTESKRRPLAISCNPRMYLDLADDDGVLDGRYFLLSEDSMQCSFVQQLAKLRPREVS